MGRTLAALRPFGIALAGFIFLNLLLAIQKPTLSATRIWLYLQMPEPWLSAFAGILGLALLCPKAWCVRPGARLLIGGILCGFAALATANCLGYYLAIRRGRLATDFPVPFSAIIAAILFCEAARAIYGSPPGPRLPAPARRFLGALSVAGAFLLLILAHIVTFGATDYAPAADDADAVVVLGARVHPDGTLSPALLDRLETGIQLFHRGRAPFLILSGGVEADGTSEPRAMAAHARLREVPDSALILDEGGVNTYASALNCGAIARERGFRKLLVVSQYFHNARVKLIFERVGTPCYTVPARGRRLVREGYFLLREAFAFPFYYLYYR